MNFQPKKPFLNSAIALFSALSACIILFFIIFRFNELSAVFSKLFSIISPFIYGAAIAYLLKPVVSFFEKAWEKVLPEKQRKRATSLSILCSFLASGAVIYAIFALILPELYTSVLSFATVLPDRVTQFVKWLQEFFANDPVLVNYITTSYESISTWFQEFFNTTVLPQITNIVSGLGLGVLSAVGTIVDFLIGLFVAVYLLASRHRFAQQGKLLVYSVFNKKWADLLMYEFSYADKKFGGFINGKLLDSFIIGLLCYIVSTIFSFPSPILLSIIIGVTNIVPFFGPFIGGIPATIFVLLNDPMQGLWFGIFVLILQQLDGNIIGPKILGDSTGVSSFWVLFSIIFFGGIWGFAGMIVGVPLFAVIYDISRELILLGLKQKHREDLITEYHDNYSKTPTTKIMKQTDKTETAI